MIEIAMGGPAGMTRQVVESSNRQVVLVDLTDHYSGPDGIDELPVEGRFIDHSRGRLCHMNGQFQRIRPGSMRVFTLACFGSTRIAKPWRPQDSTTILPL
jgi:hypothetical protein